MSKWRPSQRPLIRSQCRNVVGKLRQSCTHGPPSTNLAHIVGRSSVRLCLTVIVPISDLNGRPKYRVAPYVTVKGSCLAGCRSSQAPHLRPRNYSALLGCGTAPITVFRESYGPSKGSRGQSECYLYAVRFFPHPPNRFFNIIARGPRLNPSYLLTCDWISAKCQGQSENRLEADIGAYQRSKGWLPRITVHWSRPLR